MGEPRWFQEAARLLTSGATVTDTARACGITREALSRRLHAPGSSLAAEVERRRGQLATEPADRSAALLEQAMAVLEGGLTSSDPRRSFDAAKAILGKLAPSQQVLRVEPVTAEPITPDQAVRELAHAMVDAEHLVAGGDVSPEAVAALTAAASRLLAASPPVARPELVPATTNGVGAAPAEPDAHRPQLLQ